MSTTSTYLNFSHNTEETFQFYRSVFGGEFKGLISRFGKILEEKIFWGDYYGSLNDQFGVKWMINYEVKTK
ncbi:hypothetical protein H7169_03850 [Candidatus Gracilibacteria bacterium]|nr:hypothetical protein [Candidatus Gracilibacteria bacterium]